MRPPILQCIAFFLASPAGAACPPPFSRPCWAMRCNQYTTETLGECVASNVGIQPQQSASGEFSGCAFILGINVFSMVSIGGGNVSGGGGLSLQRR